MKPEERIEGEVYVTYHWNGSRYTYVYRHKGGDNKVWVCKETKTAGNTLVSFSQSDYFPHRKATPEEIIHYEKCEKKAKYVEP